MTELGRAFVMVVCGVAFGVVMGAAAIIGGVS